MSDRTLDQWLAWQESLHPAGIKLGLERCRPVARRMGWPAQPFFLFTVGGTNGKGSCAALLESILLASGRRPGVYSSPHLRRYNERVRVAGSEVSDDSLCAAFERVEQARGAVRLTYFEFGTLAAMDVFHRAACDVVILEVGLGGRLDATNLFDADVAILSTIALDHADWLGDNREDIGREKAGIFRPGGIAVCGDPLVPDSILEAARTLDSTLYLAGRDYSWSLSHGGWRWGSVKGCFKGLPEPALRGQHQLQNAATVLMALEASNERVPVSDDAVRQGLSAVSLPGRLQLLSGAVERIMDVAHNPQAAGGLASFLRQRRCGGRTRALLAMMRDKDMTGVAGKLASVVDEWGVATLDGPRGATAAQLAQALVEAGVRGTPQQMPDVSSAYERLRALSRPGDRIVVFGSFVTVAEALRLES